ncbi:MAG TPA: riboflavin synthase [Actinomycetales bacterium]|nr:riboflavin synthase [Actinomycetales bacterium]
MFTGIVEELGTLEAVETLGDSARLRIRGPLVTSDAGHGDSIAVNGVCLTVTEFTPGETFAADVMAETLDRTALGDLESGDPVNLERAMRADARFGGHIVQGHVDGTAALISRTEHEHWHVVRFSLPADLARYVVEKGSITVSGTSLTVSAVSGPGEAEPWFEVSLIPTTLEATVLGALGPGDRVNLEVDVLAKYVERLLAAGGGATD